MRVVESFEKLQELLPAGQGCALTIGVFDGVHAGHQKLVQRTIDEARAGKLSSLVITFAEHPLAVLAPPYAPKRLILPERKEQVLEAMGVDFVACVRFSKAFAHQSPEEFIEQTLVGRCRMRTIICGHDFHFGRSGTGDVHLLRSYGERLGFSVIELGKVLVHGTLVKSTMIRDLVFAGDVERAATLLTRPYEVKGRVVTGFGRGRKLGFPTANLELLPNYIVPARGVYLCATHIEGEPGLHPTMLNIGYNPTFDVEKLSVEAHLLDVNQDLVGRTLHLFFLSRLRDERKFKGVEALIEQLDKDKSTSRELLETPEVKARLREARRIVGR